MNTSYNDPVVAAFVVLPSLIFRALGSIRP
jgi:hypothetical protein